MQGLEDGRSPPHSWRGQVALDRGSGCCAQNSAPPPWSPAALWLGLWGAWSRPKEGLYFHWPAPGGPCGWVVLRWPEAPPALPLAVAGWQQRLPLAVAETSACPACGRACGGGGGVGGGGGWSGTWGGSGGGADPGAPGVVAMMSPGQSPHFSVLRASGGSFYFPERAESRKGINAVPQRALATLGSVDKMRCPLPREASHPGGLSGVQEPRVGWGRVSCGCGPGGCGCGPSGCERGPRAY